MISESSVAVQMQGGCVIARAAAMCHRAIAIVQALAMCHRAIAIVQAPAMCQRAIATVHASAMGHCHPLKLRKEA